MPTAGGSYAHPVAPGRSVASVRPGGDPGVTAQHPLHHPLSPQMTRSLALPQKALPFLKSASPCRALLPSKPRKVKALATPSLGAARALVVCHHPRCHVHPCGPSREGVCLLHHRGASSTPSLSVPNAGVSVIRAARALFGAFSLGRRRPALLMEACLGGPSVLCLPSGPAPPASPSSPTIPCQAPACQRARLSLPPGLFEHTGRFRVSQGGSQSPLGRPGSGYTRETCPEAAGGSLEGSPPDPKRLELFLWVPKIGAFFFFSNLQNHFKLASNKQTKRWTHPGPHVRRVCRARARCMLHAGPRTQTHDAHAAASAALPALPRGSPCTPGSLRLCARLGVPGRCTPGSLRLRARLGVPGRCTPGSLRPRSARSPRKAALAAGLIAARNPRHRPCAQPPHLTLSCSLCLSPLCSFSHQS